MTARTAALIVAWNGKQDLERCLHSLHKALKDAPSIDLCVVDNASVDGTAEWVQEQHPSVRCIHSSKNLGFAGGNNLGLRTLLEQNYEYILLLNQDIIAVSDFLTPLLTCMDRHPEIGMAQPVILQYRFPGRINTDGNPIHFLGFGFSGNCDQSIDAIEPAYGNREFISIPAASGAAVLIRASLLKEIGLFDDFFFNYNEDLDLAWRARLTGSELVLCPQARIFHNYEYTRPTRQKIGLLERNRIATLVKNYRTGTLLLLSPAFILFEIFMILYSVRENWFKMKIHGYLEIINQKPSLYKKRKQVQKYRKISDRQVTERFTSSLNFNPVASPLVSVGNLVLKYYWILSRRLIFW